MAGKEQEEIQRLRKEIRALKRRISTRPLSPKTAEPGRREKTRRLLFQALIDAFPDVVLLLNKDGKLLACNKAASLRLKKNKKGKSDVIFDLFRHPASRTWKMRFFECHESGRPLRFEKEFEGKFYSHYLYPVPGGDGGSEHLVVFVQDVTDYHLTVDALSSSEEKYKMLLDNISDVIYSVNEDGVIIYINRAVEAFLGYSDEEVKGGSFENFLHPEDVRLVNNDLEGFLSGTAQQKEYRFRHKNDTNRWGRVSSHPVFFRDTVIGYQGVITDITQAKSFNLSLIQAAQENILWSLASSFAAEIEDPIRQARNVLLKHASFREGDAPVDLTVRKMMHDLERISLYVKNYLVITESAAGESRAINVNTLIENSLALVKKQYETQQIELEWVPARDLSPVTVNPRIFIQVFLNLFAHSIAGFSRHHIARKRIHISTAMQKDMVVILFGDNSRGISDELLAHLADPYYACQSELRGGVGLTIAMNLVENNRGTFEVRQGKNHEGMEIKITLPAFIEVL